MNSSKNSDIISVKNLRNKTFERLIIFVFFVVLIIGCGFYAAFKVNSYKDELLYEKLVLEGEDFECDKLSILVKNNVRYHCWKSKLNIANYLDAKSEYLYNRVKRDDLDLMPGDYECSYNMTTHGSKAIDKFEKILEGLNDLKINDIGPYYYLLSCEFERYGGTAIGLVIEEVFKKMYESKIAYEEIYLKDYFDYFPISLQSVNSRITDIKVKGDEDVKGNKGNDMHFIEYSLIDLSEYIKIPIKDDMKLLFNLNVDENNIDMEMKFAAPYEYSVFNIIDVFDEKNKVLYLSFQGTEAYEIPEEYRGIMKIPYTEDMEKERLILDMQGAEMLLKLEDEKLCEIGILKDKAGKDSNIVLLTESDKNQGKYKLSFYTREEFEFIDEIEVYDEGCKTSEIESPILKVGTGGLVLFYSDGKLDWIDEKNYKIEFSSKFDGFEKHFERFLKNFTGEFSNFDAAFVDGNLYLLITSDDNFCFSDFKLLKSEDKEKNFDESSWQLPNGFDLLKFDDGGLVGKKRYYAPNGTVYYENNDCINYNVYDFDGALGFEFR